MTFAGNSTDCLKELLAVTEPLSFASGALEEFWSLAECEYPDSCDGALVRRAEFVCARERDFVEPIASRLGVIEEALENSYESMEVHDSEDAAIVLRRLLYPGLKMLVHSLDFVLELRQSGDFLLRYERIFVLLVAVGRRQGIERENHDGMGYHFHYLPKRGKGRSNVLFTFDPDEASPPDSLYWENHGSGVKTSAPAIWGHSRIRAVYDSAYPSLMKPGKTAFRRPSGAAQVLWSQ
jgi:hypothetical protein